MTVNPTPTEHVGQRIRLFRKKSGYTLMEFSKMIHRSVSAISKYETGMVPIDVDTMFEIADALGVSVNELTDYRNPKAAEKERNGESGAGSVSGSAGALFKPNKIYYMYQYSGFDKRTNKCVLEIIEKPESDKDRVVLYYGVKDESELTKCDYYYSGNITYAENNISIQASNPYNEADKVSIYAKAPSSQGQTSVTGLILTLAESLRTPYAAKIVFSTKPLPINADLLGQLMVNDRESMAEFRRSNALVVY